VGFPRIKLTAFSFVWKPAQRCKWKYRCTRCTVCL